MKNILTHREKNVLIIVVIMVAVLGIALTKGWVDQVTLEAWSTPVMLFIVVPLGIYIVTDQERLAIFNGLENGTNSNPYPNNNIGNNE